MKKTLSFPAVFFGVFIHPRETTRDVIENKYFSFVLPMIIFYSVLAALNPAFFVLLSKYMSFAEAAIVSVVVMTGFGIGYYFISSRLTYWVGAKFEGKGNLQEVRAANGLVYAPLIAGVILKMIMDLPAQINLINSSVDVNNLNPQDFIKVVNPVSSFLALIFVIWSMFSWFLALSEAHQFSVGKAVKTTLVLLAIFVGFLLVVIILGILIAWLSGLLFR